ncbi:MAG: glycosyltransferase family 4 protein [Candidatus Bathyarchaeia archaeon]
MSKLTVAVFNTQPPHLYRGGVERRIMELSKRLRGKINTEVYSGTKARFNKVTIVDGAVLVPCFSTDKFFPLDNWFFNRTLSRMYDAIKADVYEAHTVSGYGFLKTLKKRKAAKPFIQTIHGVLADEYIQSFKISFQTPRTRLSRLLMRHLSKIEMDSARNATLIVTISRYSLKKIVQLYNIEEARIRIVPNGVDPQRFKPTRGSEKIKHKIGVDDKSCVLFVGNLVPRKGLHFLIEAAKNIVKENREVKFIIAGEGPLKNNLIWYAKTQNVLRNFIFLGDVPEDMLPALYNCSDLVVLPSIQEGQGITLLEAQATAKPVIAFDVGAVNEVVVNKKTGLLTRPNSYELANAILSLLLDRSLREKMGRWGRKFVCNNFSWDLCAQKMLQVYYEALELAT